MYEINEMMEGAFRVTYSAITPDGKQKITGFTYVHDTINTDDAAKVAAKRLSDFGYTNIVITGYRVWRTIEGRGTGWWLLTEFANEFKETA